MIKKCGYCGTVNLFNKTGFCKNCDRRLEGTVPKESNNSKPEGKAKVTSSIIDSELDAKTLIERLRGMSNISRSTDKGGRTLGFTIEKNGSFMVDSDKDKSVFVSGKIYEESGKAKILIKESLNPPTKMQTIIYIVHTIIITVLCMFLKPVPNSFVKAGMLYLIVLAIVIYSLINQVLTAKKNLSHANEDLKIMKGEVIRRVRAAEKWDD